MMVLYEIVENLMRPSFDQIVGLQPKPCNLMISNLEFIAQTRAMAGFIGLETFRAVGD